MDREASVSLSAETACLDSIHLGAASRSSSGRFIVNAATSRPCRSHQGVARSVPVAGRGLHEGSRVHESEVGAVCLKSLRDAKEASKLVNENGRDIRRRVGVREHECRPTPALRFSPNRGHGAHALRRC